MSGSGTRAFAEVAEGVFVLRYPVLDVNVWTNHLEHSLERHSRALYHLVT